MSRNDRRPQLWHRTCSHAADSLGNHGELDPTKTAIIAGLGQIVWLSTNPDATRWDLGITSHTLDCDRMEYLYRSSGPNRAVPWAAARLRIPIMTRWLLEHDVHTKAERPHATWWISFRPVNVRLHSPIRPPSNNNPRRTS